MIEQHDRRTAGSINALLEGAQLGHYSVPKSLTDAQTTRATISEELSRALAELDKLGTMDAATAPLATNVLEAARAGKPLPDVSAPLAKLEQALQAARLRVSVLRAARELAARDLLFGTPAEDVIIEHLRPALAAVMEEVAALVPKLEGRDVENAQGFLRAPETAREAYARLSDLAYQYSALRDAQRSAGRLLDGPQVDKGNKFAEFRDPEALGVPVSTGNAREVPQPIPEHRLARLIWLATTARNQVWMPLPAEQDEQAAAYFQRADNRRLAAFSM